MDDLPHRGFDCFNDLLKRWQPDVHCFGHVHREYGNFRRESVHPSGTRLINVSGMYILEV
jgi:Icc-related predicted phosphoesterase